MPRKTRPAVASKDYPPGWFTEPVRAWTQMRWAGALTVPDDTARYVDLAKLGREKAQSSGTGWAAGSLALPGTPKGRPRTRPVRGGRA